MRTPTPRDIATAIDRTLTAVRLRWDAKGELPPALLMMWVGEEEGTVDQIEQVPAKFVIPFFDDAAGKDRLMQFLLAMLTLRPPNGDRNPDIVMQVSEAWAVLNAPRNYAIAPSESPDRSEVVIIVAHTAFGSTVRTLMVDPATRQLTDRGTMDAAHGRMQVAEWVEATSDPVRH